MLWAVQWERQRVDERLRLEAQWVRVRLRLQRYMRRFADRLVGGAQLYTDAAIGPDEARRVLGVGADSGGGQAWLDALGVPPLVQVEAALSARVDDHADEVDTALRARFGLSDRALSLLYLAAAPYLSLDLSRAYCIAWADATIKRPTVSFLCDLLGDASAETELTGQSPLIQGGLLRLTPHPRWGDARLHCYVEVPQQVLDHLSGATQRAGLAEVISPPSTRLLDLDDVERALLAARDDSHLVWLYGALGSGRRSVTARAFSAQGVEVLSCDAARAFASCDEAQLPARVGALTLEAALLGAALFLRLDHVQGSPLAERLQRQADKVSEQLARARCPIILALQRPDDRLKALAPNAVTVRVPAPSQPDQATIWYDALREGVGPKRARAFADAISALYQLPLGMIRRVAAGALRGARPSPKALTLDSLSASARAALRHRLDTLGDALTPTITLDQVVLSDDARAQFQEIIQYAQHAQTVYDRWGFDSGAQTNRGLSVLFSGPPGTGKTLCAGVLAKTLGRALFRVDLSRIVDKYIGETEKNLARVFDEAEAAQAVLLFDEADSLFAKRTQVKSSNDRYANLEVNYLLQRIEAYPGVSVLTTNFATLIDEAFQRRIRFKVHFPMPDAIARAHLWWRLLPPRAPVEEGIDFERLGQDFALSGGHIRNAVLRAAVQAAERGAPLSEEQLYDAGLTEQREMGSLVADR
jgi:AAA+ superfamily predicted ATPase